MTDVPAGALAAIRVLDLSSRLSGAFCARQLGDLGADVVVLETPSGHALRQEPPFLHEGRGEERSLLHAYANFNKRSVRLDLDDERRAALTARADVVVVSSRGHLEAIRPHVRRDAVLVAVTAYGLTGDLADAPGNDLTAYARSGWAAINGFQGQPPLKGSSNQVGYLSGTLAACGALAALVERRKSGEGQTVDVSETEALTITAGPTLLMTSYEGRDPVRQVADIFSGPVPAEDGHVSITFSRAHFWRDAMNALGLERLAEDPRYLDPWTRRQHRAELAPQIEAKVAERDRWGLFEHLGLLRCVSGVVLDMSDLAENPHLRERGVQENLVVDGEEVEILGAPYKMTATPWGLRRDPPRLGQHTDEVLTEWLSEVPT
ncbi:MAG: CoA transferase [Dehalococcoidia bacterium]|nr:CoA transferase [Dehalococcoidia bacterium]